MTRKLIGVSCHDAGAAEITSSYVLHHLASYKFIYSLSGPATKIFEKKVGKFENNSIDSLLQQSDCIYSGTGWNSENEITGIMKALSLNKYSIVFLDHWVNYKERFEFKGKQFLPNEIWVSDIYAENKALELFKGVKIKLIKNYFLNDLKDKYKKVSCLQKKKSKNLRALFLSDNNNSVIDSGFVKDNSSICKDEEMARYFLENISLLAKDVDQVVIRPHPSELQTMSKYKSIFDKYKVPFVIGGKSDLLEEISSSDLIVGGDSMALVISAIACGKKTYTCVPPEAKYTLPYKEIQEIRKIKKDL